MQGPPGALGYVANDSTIAHSQFTYRNYNFDQKLGMNSLNSVILWPFSNALL